jgi:hypothetical protein
MRYPCAACTSSARNPAATARRVASANARSTAAMPAGSSASGTGWPGAKGTALGPTTRHPPRLSGIGAPPSSHGACVLAFRPACAIWRHGTAPWASTKRTMRASGSIWPSSHSPRSPGEIRPRGSTAVASNTTSPAPPTARLPRWTRCQSFARPSSAEYWHMGETAMRLRRVTSRSVSGSKSMVRI